MSVDRKDDKKKLNDRLNAIKSYLHSKEQKIKQDVNNLGDNFFDKANVVSHKLGSIGSDSVKKLPKLNIFEDLVDMLSTSISNDNLKISNNPSSIHLKSSALQATALVGRKVNEIVRDEFMRGLYVSTQLGCGVDSEITATEVRIKPTEFDLLELLKINPSTTVGSFLYEGDSYPNNPYALNRMFYYAFSGGKQNVYSRNSSLLFSVEWDKTNKEYIIRDILSKNVYNFIVEYFVTVTLFERKNLYGVIVALLTGVLSIDRSTTYVNNLNVLNRLVSRIFSFCQEKSKSDESIKSDNMKEFEDLPYDVINLFEFDDIEGLFIEEEQLRGNRVIKFTDCNNVEVPVDGKRIEEFLEDFDRNDNEGSGNNEYVTNFLNDIAYNAFQHTGGSIPLELLRININKNFIKNLPKALVHLLLTPKAIFPFVLIRRIFGAAAEEGKNLLKSIFKIIFRIVRRIFEEFVAEFFRLVKKEILRLIGIIIQDALKELGTKRITIIKQLIGIFRSLGQLGDITSCSGLVKAILGLLSTTTNIPFSVPTPLLLGATLRSGFSNIRAFINVVEELNNVGIPTGDLYGQPNKHVLSHLAHIKGVEKERTENSVVNATIVAGTVGPLIIPPGTVKITGIIS